MRINKSFILVLFISTVFAQSYIDIVTLKNGDIIKGQIIEYDPNKHIRIELQGGSILTYQSNLIENIEIEEFATKNLRLGTKLALPKNNYTPVNNYIPIKNCFSDGYNSGISVSTNEAQIGGFIGGLGLGLIGWGLSYAIVASGNPQPPSYEISSLDESCSREYSRGYNAGALKVKKSAVNMGGALGTLLIITIFINLSG